MKQFKEYEAPTVEVLALSQDDILTSSQGFEGEEHPIFGSPFFG